MILMTTKLAGRGYLDRPRLDLTRCSCRVQGISLSFLVLRLLNTRRAFNPVNILADDCAAHDLRMVLTPFAILGF